MKGRPLALARDAARAFAAALRSTDRMMVLAIGGETIVASPLSADRRSALAALQRLDTWGTTPLYDATIAAIDAIQAATGRRALILWSDGTDRYSEARAMDVVARARTSDVLIYPVAIGRARPPLFAELATVSGGRSFFLGDPRELESALTTIARELRAQYLLGYSSSKASRGRAKRTRFAWRSRPAGCAHQTPDRLRRALIISRHASPTSSVRASRHLRPAYGWRPATRSTMTVRIASL